MAAIYARSTSAKACALLPIMQNLQRCKQTKKKQLTFLLMFFFSFFFFSTLAIFQKKTIKDKDLKFLLNKDEVFVYLENFSLYFSCVCEIFN